MGKCIDFNGYILHEECVERIIKNKIIVPSRYYLIDGILPKCPFVTNTFLMIT